MNYALRLNSIVNLLVAHDAVLAADLVAILKDARKHNHPAMTSELADFYGRLLDTLTGQKLAPGQLCDGRD